MLKRCVGTVAVPPCLAWQYDTHEQNRTCSLLLWSRSGKTDAFLPADRKRARRVWIGLPERAGLLFFPFWLDRVITSSTRVVTRVLLSLNDTLKLNDIWRNSPKSYYSTIKVTAEYNSASANNCYSRFTKRKRKKWYSYSHAHHMLYQIKYFGLEGVPILWILSRLQLSLNLYVSNI